MSCHWAKNDKWKVTQNLSEKNWADPRLGQVNTGNFIAALASALFTGQILNITQIEEEPQTYIIRFFGHQRIAEPPGLQHHDDLVPMQITCIDVAIDEHLLVENDTLVWASNCSDPLDIWPGLYEKAYITLCRYQREGLYTEHCTSVTCNKPLSYPLPLSQPSWDCINSRVIPFEYGILPLFHLVPYSKDRFVEPPYVSELAKICDESGRATKPAITWTKDSIPKGNCPRTRITYAYSVLGLFPDAVSPAEVVLRDPSGTGSSMSNQSDWNGIPLNSGNGIITVSSRVWETCFRKFSFCY